MVKYSLETAATLTTLWTYADNLAIQEPILP